MPVDFDVKGQKEMDFIFSLEEVLLWIIFWSEAKCLDDGFIANAQLFTLQ